MPDARSSRQRRCGRASGLALSLSLIAVPLFSLNVACLFTCWLSFTLRLLFCSAHFLCFVVFLFPGSVIDIYACSASVNAQEEAGERVFAIPTLLHFERRHGKAAADS